MNMKHTYGHPDWNLMNIIGTKYQVKVHVYHTSRQYLYIWPEIARRERSGSSTYRDKFTSFQQPVDVAMLSYNRRSDLIQLHIR